MHLVVIDRAALRLGAAVLGTLLIASLAAPARRSREQPVGGQPGHLQASVFRRAPTSRAAVALTFDDGPDPRYTPRILEILDRYQARATFFILGTQAEAYPDLLRDIVRRGHEVGTHGYRHVDLTKLKPETVAAELKRADDLIAAATGRRPRDLRPPYGFINQNVLNEAGKLGYRIILWTDEHDPRDWKRPAAGEIARRSLDRAEKGMILLLHDSGGNREQTVRALPIILERLRDQGYQVVTVDELLAQTTTRVTRGQEDHLHKNSVGQQ